MMKLWQILREDIEALLGRPARVAPRPGSFERYEADLCRSIERRVAEEASGELKVLDMAGHRRRA